MIRASFHALDGLNRVVDAALLLHETLGWEPPYARTVAEIARGGALTRDELRANIRLAYEELYHWRPLPEPWELRWFGRCGFRRDHNGSPRFLIRLGDGPA